VNEGTFAVEAEAEAKHWWFVGRRDLFARLIREMGLPPEAKVLDVGTSTGTNLRMLRDMGLERVEGLDLSEEAIRWCAAKGLGRVSRGSICDMPFPSESFDLVLATDVIEHVDDDRQALDEVRRVLRPGGKALITVPAFTSLWGLQDEVAQHKRRYRRAGVVSLASQAGFVCTRDFYFNYLLFVPIYLVRRLLALTGVRLESENQLNSPLLNRLLLAIFRFDIRSAAVVRPPFGVSHLMILERSRMDVPTGAP
jgi:SAM-dependent methyltransferase